MEVYQSYKNYSITYYSSSGTTVIDKWGFLIKIFDRLGEIKGDELAKSYIDKYLAEETVF